MAVRQWWIRVRGTQRKEVNSDLLVAAIMAFGQQLHTHNGDQLYATEDRASTADDVEAGSS
jgi:hypothetical protein